ncbi:hypothetical protein C8Q79DRAFT_421616 [Trametes meyenii]|nr:hypothetical protein C8Q79DRAFT_421616 [Trametes meyenii]
MGTSYIALFLDPLTSILICRFILNLRETNEQSRISSTSSLTLEFGVTPSGSPPFVQSMAGPVHLTSLTNTDTSTTSNDVVLSDLN